MMKRRVPINWDDLEMALTMHMDESTAYLDLRTGQVEIVGVSSFEDEREGLSEEEMDAGLAGKYLVAIEPLPSYVEYRWMAEFTDSVSDPQLGELLQVAIQGRGAFGRFKRVLSDRPAERERWFTLRNQRMLEVMQDWFADHDIEPTTEPPARQ
ncbi:MAG: hypothetical protein HYY65_07530 [Candidatus Tectomicrobia bacterium]|uniref:Uncharacterized protein n=1 Tax=Tectimicrobiota bacterium TaxID=2528274 RepID=A0A932GPE9_UNCTE|nr:hypothetical protein [Candidatus Tectomicrobia bacterium]